ncbi:MAG TPA: hypothetical protein VMV75_10940 [Sulfuricella sp.]|nr:hypothetical protein [Sulfuricella sp.]
MNSENVPMERQKAITCFLPAGQGLEVLDRLRREKGVNTAFVHHARGVGVGSRNPGRVLIYEEREIITALVPEAEADDIFNFLYFAAKIDQPHAGMVLMEKAIHARACPLPDLPDEG